jgi:hypothetical protein
MRISSAWFGLDGWLALSLRVSVPPPAARRHRWIAQGTIPKWAPHSWFAGTLPGLPVRCCMMIGVNNR